MFQTLRNAWKVEDLRKKILFTLFVVLLFRIGNAVPVPYVNTVAMQQWMEMMRNTYFGLMDVMSGGAFSQATIFALSIQPYINASIIIQLLCIAIPALERMSKEEGEEGRKKIASITRYSTVAIGLLQGIGAYALLNSRGYLLASNFWVALVVVLTLTSGSAVVMWLGEQITEHGIGNGISIILFVGIISRFPAAVAETFKNIGSGNLAWWIALLMYIGALLMIILIVFVNDAERRVPVQYAKRVVGRKMYGGQSTHLPMKVNMSGVMPIIFAQTIASLPATIAAFLGKTEGFFTTWNTSLVYAAVYLVLIIFFAYFYSTIQFNPVEVANNLKKNGGYIPGFRPGKPTSEFIQRVLNKITLFGALYLGIIAVVPILISHFSSSSALTGLSIGGTSIIIVVGVALETFRAIEAQIMMRNYKGFLS